MMKRVLFFLAAGAAVCSAVPLTIVTNVEPQPFTAQVKRLIEATDYLGVPFEAADKKKLQAAVEKGDTAELQGVLDRRSEEHTSELQSQSNLVCRLLLEKKKKNKT